MTYAAPDSRIQQPRPSALGPCACSPLLDLRLADCMAVMREMPDNAYDLAIVDPPYGRGEDGGTNRNHGVKQRNGTVMLCRDGGYQAKSWDRKPPPPEYFAELRRVSRHQIVWGINYYSVAWPGGRIIWDKVNDGADQSGAEIAFCSLNQRVDVLRYMWRGMMQGVSIAQGTIQQGNKALNEKRIHPTQKPVKLYEWMLDTSSSPPSPTATPPCQILAHSRPPITRGSPSSPLTNRTSRPWSGRAPSQT